MPHSASAAASDRRSADCSRSRRRPDSGSTSLLRSSSLKCFWPAVNDEGRGGRAHGGAVSAVLDDLEDLRRGDDGGHRGGHLLGHPVKRDEGFRTLVYVATARGGLSRRTRRRTRRTRRRTRRA
jgi:hypothetical protein